MIELVYCDKCGAKDWKRFTDRNLSQNGDGCFHCPNGVFVVELVIEGV